MTTTDRTTTKEPSSITEHRDDQDYDYEDYEPDKFLVEVDPDADQCGKPGNGTVYVKFRADIWDSRMALHANCDFLQATVNMTLAEVNTLREDLANAVDVIQQRMTRNEFVRIIQDREATEEQPCQS